VEQLCSERVTRLGVVLAHKYSFDGGSSVPWGHLRGRDAWAAAAFAFAFGPDSLHTEKCTVKVEVSEDDDTPNTFDVFRRVTGAFPGSDVDYYDEREDGEKDKFVLIPADFQAAEDVLPDGYERVHRGVVADLKQCHGEVDDHDEGNLSWPFWFTRFLMDEKTLARCERDGAVEQESELWGNGARFDIYWYYNAALLVRFAPDPPVPENKSLGQEDAGGN
jgi:hypothetical protein